MVVRDKDLIFLAFFVPLVSIAGYVYFWRMDAVKRLEALERRNMELVAVEDFPMEKRRAEQWLADARAELEAERSIPIPATMVKADPNATTAERESEVLNVFRNAGLAVLRSEVVERRGESIAEATLKATGTRAQPVCRRYTLDGTYPAIRRALDTFSARQMAVVVEQIDMKDSGFGRWMLGLWQ